MYGLDACYLNKSQLNSLDSTINRLFMKLSKTNNIDILSTVSIALVSKCPASYGLSVISKLNEKIANCSNSFVSRFSQV